MDNDRPILQCSNHSCQALNLESHRFCSKCRSLLIKRYLWGVGASLEAYQPGDLLGDRYLLKDAQILLDTQPGAPPETPIELPPRWESYSKLFSYRLHVPQIYGWIRSDKAQPIFLLEEAPIYPSGARSAQNSDLTGGLMPELSYRWQQSSPFRQLNWLWQIAQLWQPLSAEKTASTLLNPALLRVDGASVRLLELQFDRQPPDLSQLGQLWLQWKEQIPTSVIADFLTQLCDQLIQGQIQNAEQLIDLLDQGLITYGQAQTRQVQIATSTDQGPSRQSNEDACYPPGGSFLTLAVNQPKLLAIVCDGIGGHEGGEVASNLAIATLQEQIEALLATNRTVNSAILIDGLERATAAANDLISERNDAEQRHERQRMGTTLVMGLVNAHELYVTHVGDSRAYRITRTGCYQVTLDDDVASREVRLGYALYRDAVNQPAAGSLVQALGMGSSSFLHPSVQRFVLDEDCVFLLCSDGLSDHDRVEEIWETEIAPILQGNVDLATASRRLVEVANTLNGHDNVTVALVYCQVSADQSAQPLQVDWQRSTQSSLSEATRLAAPATIANDSLKTQLVQPRRSAFGWLPPLLILVTLLGLGSLLLYLLVPELRARFNPATIESPPTPSANLPAPTSAAPIPSSSSFNASLEVGSLVKLVPQSEAVKGLATPSPEERSSQSGQTEGLAFVTLLSLPGSPATETIVGRVPTGSILQVVGRQIMADQRSWLRLKVCSIAGDTAKAPTPKASPTPKLTQAGDAGWLEEKVITPFVAKNFSVKPDQLGQCANSAASPSP